MNTEKYPINWGTFTMKYVTIKMEDRLVVLHVEQVSLNTYLCIQ